MVPVARSAVPEPLRRLMLDLLRTAIEDAQRKVTPRDRRSRVRIRHDRAAALAWLRGVDAGLTARQCCEALGFDYEAVRDRLEAAWRDGKTIDVNRAEMRGTRTNGGMDV